MSDGTEHSTMGALQLSQAYAFSAPCERVFEALTREINKWWPYRVLKNGSFMCIELWPGGRFYEANENGDGFLWGTVLQVCYPEVLRITESIGLGPAARLGTWAYRLEDRGGETLLNLTYQILGAIDASTEESLKAAWNDLFAKNLKNYIETGEECFIQVAE